MMTFQDRFRMARKKRGLTQESLAEELGISKSQISAWENGKETPSFKHLGMLRTALRTDLDSLILGSGAPRTSETIPAYLDIDAVEMTAQIEALDMEARQAIATLLRCLQNG